MTQKELQKILQEINYPGFNRDIVSFGMIKKILINNNAAIINLQINTNNKMILNQLERDIQKKLTAHGLVDIRVNFLTEPSMQANQNPINQQPIPGVKYIIAIASGKGGVGKSTVAINLAAALSKSCKVGLLDLDIYGPSLPMLVGLNQYPEITTDQKLIPIKKYNMHLMSFGFINTQKSPTIWRGPMVARMTQQFFENVKWGTLDFLILDLPPGTGDIQLTLVQKLALNGAIMVTTPQNLALLDVAKGADMFQKVNTPVLGVIENMTHFLCPNCNEISQIFPGTGGAIESKRLDVPLLGQIYLSSLIAQSGDNGIPFILEYANSPIAKEYFNIALQLQKIVKQGNNHN